MKKYMLFSFALIFIISIIQISSAAGLALNGGPFTYNKVYDNPTTFSFTITNTESFTFFNITFVDSSIVEMPLIPNLTSGQQANIIANIKTNSDNSTQL